MLGACVGAAVGARLGERLGLPVRLLEHEAYSLQRCSHSTHSCSGQSLALRVMLLVLLPVPVPVLFCGHAPQVLGQFLRRVARKTCSLQKRAIALPHA